jgi:hypothetical protein
MGTLTVSAPLACAYIVEFAPPQSIDCWVYIHKQLDWLFATLNVHNSLNQNFLSTLINILVVAFLHTSCNCYTTMTRCQSLVCENWVHYVKTGWH